MNRGVGIGLAIQMHEPSDSNDSICAEYQTSRQQSFTVPKHYGSFDVTRRCAEHHQPGSCDIRQPIVCHLEKLGCLDRSAGGLTQCSRFGDELFDPGFFRFSSPYTHPVVTRAARRAAEAQLSLHQPSGRPLKDRATILVVILDSQQSTRRFQSGWRLLESLLFYELKLRLRKTSALRAPCLLAKESATAHGSHGSSVRCCRLHASGGYQQQATKPHPSAHPTRTDGCLQTIGHVSMLANLAALRFARKSHSRM